LDIKFDFEKISAKDVIFWPIWLKALGALIVAIIVFLLGTYFYILPSLASGEKLDQEVEKLKKDYKNQFIQKQKLEKYAEILKNRDDYSILEKLIPNEPETIQFVKEVTGFAVSRHVTIQVINPLDIEPSKIKEFKRLPIKVTGYADYINIVNFLADIINMGRLVTFEKLIINESYIGQDKLSFELLLYTYFKDANSLKK